jgi:flavin reductase (DIM6/NTAB) family NADH-FMN oxidoreductase RutF
MLMPEDPPVEPRAGDNRPGDARPAGPVAAPDPRHLRDCLSEFATGVTIVSAALPDGRRAGLTVNSFNSLSLDPPLVLWSLSLRSTNLEIFSAASHFAVSVLSVKQVELARRFARAGNHRFDGVAVRIGMGGAPLVEGANAWFECELTVQQRAGDHMLFIGQVRRCERMHDADPLIFRHGRFAVSRHHPDHA